MYDDEVPMKFPIPYLLSHLPIPFRLTLPSPPSYDFFDTCLIFLFSSSLAFKNKTPCKNYLP